MFVHSDHLGTPRVVSDNSQTTVWRWDSTPFGDSAPNEDADGTQFTLNARFPGQYYDSESGLNYNYFRTYDPSTGRYIESDPIGLRGGLNTFGYVYGNPLIYIDPLGLDGLFPGLESCKYYSEKCSENQKCGEEDTYACNATKCCESFGDNFFSNCTRKCLIDMDKGQCGALTGKARDDCRRKAHIWCYTSCINILDIVGTGLGIFPPKECEDAADAIGGMWGF